MSESSFQVPANTGIAIIAPGGYVADPAAFERGIALLEAQGCIVKSYYDTTKKFQRFGGTDEGRLAQLDAAVRDPDVHIIMALRGGYGTSRLLNQIDYDAIAASGKLIVGHSDLTALQLALLAKTGCMSMAGPMLDPDFTREDPSEFTLQNFWHCLSNPTNTIHVKTQSNPVIDVSGTLWGGNLAMLTHLVGTPYMPQIDGGILFLEDLAEHPFRIERMMLQLLNAGILGRQQSILLGDFSNYRLSDYDNGYDFSAMLAYLRSQLTVPILTGLPFGHVRDKVTLALGAQARLVSQADGFSLTMNGYPAL